ncbi:hypothetical protein H5410_044059 [Solanum commersonii]|uniref:Uncharacterized protein n=1 Tax=Solanum commersonii TaxID=4109 RepID=A0A9J5XZC2_SOLCO|nr:hypothetical protein H5410_044059 [Solanum commersonii]
MEPVGPLQDQTSLGEASWPSRPKRLIFKVKRAPEQFKDVLVIQNFDHIFADIFHGSVKTLAMDPDGLTAKTAHFQGQTILENVHEFFDDPEFRPSFCQKFSWTFVKTLAMEFVGPDGQNGPFLRSNDPQSRNSNVIFAKKFTCTSVKTLTMEPASAKTAHSEDQTIPEADLSYGVSWSPRQNGPFTMSNDPRSSYGASWSPWQKRSFFKVKRSLEQVWNQLVTMAKTANLQGQTSPRADLSYRASWSPWLKQPIYKVKQSPEQTSVKTLATKPLGHHGKNNPFTRLNEPWSSYGASWSPRQKGPIFKVKRAPEQTSTNVVACDVAHLTSASHKLCGKITDDARRPHPTSANQCVQATDDTGRPRSMLADRYVQATNNAGRPRPTSANQCEQAKDDAGRPRPTSTDRCRQSTNYVA